MGVEWSIWRGAGGWARGARMRGLLALGTFFGVLVLTLVLVPGVAFAKPLCTDTWSGGSSGSWQTASNWSSGKVPSSADVACVGVGVAVEVSGGANAAGVLDDEGTLVLRGGSLELTSSLEESTVHVLTLSGGKLSGAAKLVVSSSLSWTEGTMEGSGSTVLQAAASGTVHAVTANLSERRFVNEGTFTLIAGSIELENGAVLSNGGTFNLNDNEAACGECYRAGLEKGSGSSSFVNTGKVEKAEGAGESSLGVNTENAGTIDGKSGPIAFVGGSSSVLENASVLEGTVKIQGASVIGDSFKGTSAQLTLTSGTLGMTSGDTATVGGLTLTSSTLTGAGTLKIEETLSWPEGGESTMSGSGSTVLVSGASGSIGVSGGDYANFAKRTFVNEGVLTLASGHISLSEEAKLENQGTFKVNSEATNAITLAPGGSGKLVNTGTVEKSSGAGTSQVSVPFESSGTAEAQKGQLAFTEGGSSTSTAKWLAGGGASINLAGHSFTLSGSSWSGAIDLTGANVTVEGLRDGSTAPVSLQAGTLSVAGATASAIGDLSLTGGTLDGAGTLNVSRSLEWLGEGGVMSGSGSTVLESGASGKIEVVTPAKLQGRSLVNDGTLTWGSGAIFLEEGAQISNSGTFYANDNGSSCGGGCRGTGIDPGSSGSGTFENAGSVIESAGSQTEVEVEFDNQGIVKANTGKLRFTDGGISGHTAAGSWSATGGSTAIEFTGGSFTWGSAISIAGSIVDAGATITAGDVQGSGEVDLQLKSGLLTLNGPSVSHVSELQVLHPDGKLAGAGNLNVSSSFLWNEGSMEGSGQTVIEEKATGTIEDSKLNLIGRRLVNDGVLSWPSGALVLGDSAFFDNQGVLLVIDENACEECATGISPEKWGYPGETGESTGVLINEGLIEKIAGPKTYVEVRAGNYGVISEPGGTIDFTRWLVQGETQWGGGENPQEPAQCGEEESVGCQTGNYSQTQTDFSIGGRGVGLDLSRTYNSQAAAAGEKGIFGYGWSSSFSDHLVSEPVSHTVDLVQADGSTITFLEGAGEAFTAPEWTQDTLKGSSSAGYSLTLENQTIYKFSGAGRLESVTDRNGNTTTLAYNGSGKLETITDPAGRKIKLAYNAEGLVESAEDPMKHVVKYTYESGSLATVTQPGEAALRWQFKYDGSHRMFELTDGRGEKSTVEYNALNQVISQTDPMKRETTYEYTAFHTKTTNHATGDVKMQYFTSNGIGTSLTNGYGTPSATTETSVYNAADELLSFTDGDGHTTKYGYDSHGNRILRKTPKATRPNGRMTALMISKPKRCRAARPQPINAMATVTPK